MIIKALALPTGNFLVKEIEELLFTVEPVGWRRKEVKYGTIQVDI